MKQLNRSSLKKIMGGYEDSGNGVCCACFGTEPNQYSCWYTLSTCEDVCHRVYPNSPDSNGGVVDCTGCTMN